MYLISFLLRSSWKMVAIAAFAGLVSGGCSASLIALISYALSHDRSLPWLVTGFVGLVLVVLVTSVISQVMLIRLSHHAVFRLRMGLLRQILDSELSHLETLGNARLLATLTDDVQAITNAVYMLPLLCIDLAIVSGCIGYVAWLSWAAFLLVIVLAVLALFSIRGLLRRGERWLDRAREEEDHLFQHFRAATEGVKELKLHSQRRSAFLQEDVEPTAVNFRRYNIRGLTLFAASASWGKLIFFFAIGFVLFALPRLVVLNPQAISAYVLVFIYLIVPMENISNGFPFLIRANVALRKVEKMGLLLSDRPEVRSTLPVSTDWSRLKLDGVVYPYKGDQEDSHFTLGPLNLAFTPGELVFVVGGNGSGKSTFAKLLTGLYIPTAGAIWFNDQPITAENREWYRQHFSTVFADFFLFERLLGLDQTNLDYLAKNYLHRLQLEHKVSITEGRLSTTALSQGQRKRLALLTAYLEDRPIYLFDEWAADQDPTFKEVFYKEFLPDLKAQGKTIFVISHDDHYFYIADRLIKLDNGQVEFDRR
jgi:putative ATP-binding cassette transporter